jgi:phosphofructokinase-like protein
VTNSLLNNHQLQHLELQHSCTFIIFTPLNSTLMKKLLILTGGGDCPGLNAVIRGVAKRARKEKDWEVFGCIEGFNGVFNSPHELIKLTRTKTAGIHVRGGTILKTTNKANPINFPVLQSDGTTKYIDRSDELVERLKALNFDAIINIGGDGSQKISKVLCNKGIPIIGVPKTIDNDLSATDITFGFHTAVQIATDSFDKLVTTAESHHRVMIMEVMGRDAGWIALYSALAGGAEICLIPEIPYDVRKLVKRIETRYRRGRGFVNIVIAEGAKPKEGTITAAAGEKGSEHVRLGGVAYQLSKQLKDAGCKAEIRETVLGHVQRGGSPIAFDRILATLFGVKAFELAKEKKFGNMVAFKNNQITYVTLEEATKQPNFVSKDLYLVQAAKGLNITFGD